MEPAQPDVSSVVHKGAASILASDQRSMPASMSIGEQTGHTIKTGDDKEPDVPMIASEFNSQMSGFVEQAPPESIKD